MNDSATIFYVYAIAQPSASGPGDLEVAPLPSTGILPDLPVVAVEYRDIAAIVSEAPESELGKDALESHLQNIEWVKQRVVSHQAVLDNLLAGYTIVPLKFCTLCGSREKVSELLAANYAGFQRALDQIRGATEWGVKVYSHPARLKAGVAANAPALETQRRAIAKASSGAAYMLRRKLEMGAEKEAEAMSDRCAQASHDRLAAASRQAANGSLQTPDVHGRAGMTMVLNGSYLVDDAVIDTFTAVLDALKTEYDPYGFVHELTGPWPPYNFASVESNT